MKTTKSEFDTFWNEVLGRDWYLDDPSFDDEEPTFVLDDSAIRYQGPGRGPSKPPPFVKAKEMDTNGYLDVGVATLFKRWHEAQTTVTIAAEFKVPKERADAVRQAILDLGGKI